MSYTTLLLDIDDTLLNFQTNEKQAMQRVFKAYHIDYNEENLAIYHKINRALWEKYEQGEIERETIFQERYTQFFQVLGIDADGVQADMIYRDYLNDGHDLITGAKELLTFLKENHYRIYAATNGVKETQYRRLRDANILDYFDRIYVSEDLGFQKPDGRFFDVIFQENQLKKEEALMVGDTLTSDILGGQYYNIDTVYFNWKNQPLRESIQPTYCIKQLSELIDLLNKKGEKEGEKDGKSYC